MSNYERLLWIRGLAQEAKSAGITIPAGLYSVYSNIPGDAIDVSGYFPSIVIQEV